MTYIRWEPGTKRKLLELSCVVPMTPAATAALRLGLDRELERALSRLAESAGERQLLGLPERARDFTGDWIWCVWFQQDDSLVCQGVDCWAAALLKVETLNEMALGSLYECGNGCFVAPGVGFACPDTPGGGVDVGEGDPPAGGGTSGVPEWIDGVDSWSDGNSQCTPSQNDTLCILVDLRPLEDSVVRNALLLLPIWARTPLLEILDGGRFKVWRNEVPHPTRPGPLLADLHYHPELSPMAQLHLYNPSETGFLGAFERLHEILCHEAVHRVFFQYSHDSIGFSLANQQCLAGIDQ